MIWKERISVDTGKKLYESYRRILQEEQFSEIAAIYHERVNNLQMASQSFTDEQARAVREYLDVWAVVRDIMFKLALDDPNPQSQRMMEWLRRNTD